MTGLFLSIMISNVNARKTAYMGHLYVINALKCWETSAMLMGSHRSPCVIPSSLPVQMVNLILINLKIL